MFYYKEKQIMLLLQTYYKIRKSKISGRRLYYFRGSSYITGTSEETKAKRSAGIWEYLTQNKG